MFRLLVCLIVVMATLVVVTLEPKMHKPIKICSKTALLETSSSFETRDVTFAPQNIETKSKPSIKNEDLTREEYMKSIRERAPKTQEVVVEPAKTITKQTPIKPIKVQESKPVETPKTKPMSQLNEMIVWNKWRADICNSISDNSLETQVYKLKKGVLFKYSFNVDNKRHITNINVTLSRGNYDDVVRDSILDINRTIRSMEGKSILSFPEGSQRTSVKVEGGIEMSDYDASLNPNNFSDVESVFH